jgi:4-amino-4-deoxy-L-arabinose transferase-like glycosyltransferase
VESPPAFGIGHNLAVPGARAVLPIAVVLAVVAATMVVDLGRPFGNGDEVLYAQGIREMRRGADPSVLHWGGHPVLERPVAPFVLAALGAGLVDGEIGLRLSALACALATLALLFAIARRAWGRTDAALIAVVLCAGAPSFHLFSRALLSDPPFTLTLVAAVAGALWALDDRRGLVAAGLALGAAVGLKSLAAAPAVVALAPWLVVAARRHGDRRSVALGAAGFAALALPFFTLGLLRHGEQFVAEHLGRALVARAAGELDHLGMVGGASAYLRYLVEVDGPLVAAWIAVALVGGVALAVRRRDRRLALAATVALGFALVLSLVGTRLPHYLLPLYPLAALALAGVAGHGLEAVARRRPGPLPPVAAVALAAAIAMTGLGRRDVEAHFMPDPDAVALGHAARAALPVGAPIHALEWYAPALAYYADRPLRIVTASPGLYRLVDAVDYFRATGVPLRAPPPAGPLWLAGPRAAIAGAGWLVVEEELAASGEHALVRARAVE